MPSNYLQKDLNKKAYMYKNEKKPPKNQKRVQLKYILSICNISVLAAADPHNGSVRQSHISGLFFFVTSHNVLSSNPI